MVHNHCLAKSIHDASWSGFFEKLFAKADRDVNAALNIRAVGLHSLGLALEAPCL